MKPTRRADAGGRSTRRRSAGCRADKFTLDTPYIGHSMELMMSPGFRALSMPARHILDFLELEHMRHGGVENGRLLAPYNQLVAFGVSRRDIRSAIDELEAFGIIRANRGERLGRKSKSSTYALTFYPVGADLPAYDYKLVKASDVAEFKATRSRRNDWRRGDSSDANSGPVSPLAEI